MSKGKVVEYTLDEPWDMSTATFSKDGSILYLYDDVEVRDHKKEEEIRDKYPDVQKLYDEYLFALILYGGEDL